MVSCRAPARPAAPTPPLPLGCERVTSKGPRRLFLSPPFWDVSRQIVPRKAFMGLGDLSQDALLIAKYREFLSGTSTCTTAATSPSTHEIAQLCGRGAVVL
eukprot:6693371-Prymnesium_polylepis.1